MRVLTGGNTMSDEKSSGKEEPPPQVQVDLKDALAVKHKADEIISQKVAQFYKKSTEALRKMVTELDIANAKKEQEFKDIEELYKNLIHDIKSPIQINISLCEILLGLTDDNDEMQELISTIKRNGEQLLKKINSELIATEYNQDMSHCNPNAIINSIVQNAIKNSNPERRQAVKITYRNNRALNQMIDLPYLPFVNIISNLMSNAQKFTHKGHIHISFRHSTSKEYEFTLKVQDTGYGIPKEDIPHIFDEGFCNKKGNCYGSGFGLAEVKKSVEKLRGDIKVSCHTTSQKHSGTTFTARFSSTSFKAKK